MEIKAIQLARKFIHISIWCSLIIIYSLVLVDRDINALLFISTTLLLTLLSASTIYRVWYTLIPKYLEKDRGLKFSLVLLSWLFFGAIALQIYLTLVVAFMRGITVNDLPGLAGNGFMLTVFMWIMIIAWSIILIAKNQNESRIRIANLQQKLAESEGQRKELELAQLKAQLQPHFLFNTLNTIYGAAIRKSDETPTMIMELSAMLDYGLYQASKEQVPLTDEVAQLERYLGLEKQRFRDGLKVNFEKSGDLALHSVPPLLLMPLVENAVKHGKTIDDQLSINIALQVADNSLVFEVNNPSQSNDNPKGIGLENLQKRLQNLYPQKHELIFEKKDDTFMATLRIPLD